MGDVLKFKDTKLSEIYRIQRTPNKDAPNVVINLGELQIVRKFIAFLVLDIKYQMNKFKKLDKINESIVTNFILEYLVEMDEDLEHPVKSEE
jgi:hypothetical protein